jgi:glycerol-3-phosphate acyltransferase PlsY
MIEVLLAAAWGYLLGSVPTGVLVCKAVGAPDIRRSGSGHTGGLNVSRAAGLWAGVLTGVVDGLLGVGAVAGTALLTDDPWAATAAGVMVVVGHNWSIFIRFAGGIGLSSLFGAVFFHSPLSAVLMLAILGLLWVALVKLLRVHRARATILALLPGGPLLWALGESWAVVMLGVLGGLAIILKTLPDWNRQYE